VSKKIPFLVLLNRHLRHQWNRRIYTASPARRLVRVRAVLGARCQTWSGKHRKATETRMLQWMAVDVSRVARATFPGLCESYPAGHA